MYGEYILREESERLDVYGEWEIRCVWRIYPVGGE